METTTNPARPPVAEPEPKSTDPLFPLLALPELKSRTPLVPTAPEFDERILIVPLLVAVPSPLETLIAPPVLTVLRPEAA